MKTLTLFTVLFVLSACNGGGSGGGGSPQISSGSIVQEVPTTFVSEIKTDIPASLQLQGDDLAELKQEGVLDEEDAQVIQQYL